MKHRLLPHADAPSVAALAISVEVERDGGCMTLCYVIEGDLAAVRFPEIGIGQRRDGLWQATCFEAFARTGDGPGYREFNLSPSGDWAAYDFDSWRAGMRESAVVPVIAPLSRSTLFARIAVDADVDWHLSLTAVIEEVDGTKSYWALAHPPGPPDFHHPDCFVLKLPAAGEGDVNRTHPPRSG